MLAEEMSKRDKKEKAKSFINEAFSLSCLLAKNIALVRYRTNRKLLFSRNKKLVNYEEFRAIVFKEFEDGIEKLPINILENLENTSKNIVDEIKNGKQQKLQKMIENSYNQFLKEAKT